MADWNYHHIVVATARTSQLSWMTALLQLRFAITTYARVPTWYKYKFFRITSAYHAVVIRV